MKNIFKVIRLAKPYHKYIYLISFLIIVTTILELVSPYLLKLIVDQIESQITTGGGDLERLYILIFLMFATSIVSTGLESVNMRLGDYTTARVGRFLTEKFYRKIFTLPQRYFDTQISGKIINQLNRGIIAL